MATATYTIEIDWAGGPFIIGASTLGGGDQLGGAFGNPGFDKPNDNISGEGIEFQIRRGRDDPFSPFRSGECRLKLFDLDGKFNPEEASSPLHGLMIPMRPVRIRAEFLGVTYGLFYGYIRTIEYDPRSYTTTILAEDLFLWLSRVNPEASEDNQHVGHIIQEILTNSKFEQPSLIDVDVNRGEIIPTFSMLGSVDARSALSGINDVLEVDRGLFYVNRNGVVTYEWRDKVMVKQSTATFSVTVNTYPGVSMDNLFNRARVTKEGGVTQEAVDQGSLDAYGPSDISIDSPYLADEAQAMALANHLIFLYSNPRAPVWALPLFGGLDDATLIKTLSLELGQRITLISEQAGVAGDYIVESIMHQVVHSAEHRTELVLTKRVLGEGEALFEIGASTLGGGDILGTY